MSYPKFRGKHNEGALFSPNDFIRWANKVGKKKIPKNIILTYQKDSIDYIKRIYKPKKIRELSNRAMDFYLGDNIAYISILGIGCPHAVTVFEELIAMGGKNFINVGTCGGLQHECICLCERALRDEGTSYHYIAHGDYSYPDEKLTKKLENVLKKKKLDYKRGTTWTIDAPYRETVAEVKKYKKQGIITVEMEASALFAVAKVRKVKIASAFSISDILGAKWEPKFDRIEVKKRLHEVIDAAVECLK